MNLTSPSQVKAWCIEHDFHPNRTLGQNFLIDRNALCAIVDAGLEGAESGAEVLEIGPGMGVLTEEMLSRGMKVTAVEKDPVLAARLAESLGNPAALRVVAGDALDVIASPAYHGVDLAAFDCMVSNLPYQAGTRIMLELVERRMPKAMTVLVQTEVAERLAAGEGSKTRGLAGVWTQLDYDVRIVRKVAASCFWPRPEIGSTVVRIDRHDRNAALSEDERKLFHRLTKQAFEHRRKQLGSIFKGADALFSGAVSPTARAEELSNAAWISLVKSFPRA